MCNYIVCRNYTTIHNHPIIFCKVIALVSCSSWNVGRWSDNIGRNKMGMCGIQCRAFLDSNRALNMGKVTVEIFIKAHIEMIIEEVLWKMISVTSVPRTWLDIITASLHTNKWKAFIYNVYEVQQILNKQWPRPFFPALSFPIMFDSECQVGTNSESVPLSVIMAAPSQISLFIIVIGFRIVIFLTHFIFYKL